MLVGASGQAGHPALARDERFRVLWLISGLMTGPTFSFPSFVGGKFHNCVHILPVHHVSSCTWLLASLYEQRGRPLLLLSISFEVMYDSWRPYAPQDVRPLCSPPSPGVCSNPCPSSWWCHPTISFSVVPFSSFLQSFPTSGSFPMSQGAKVLELQLQHQPFQWIFRVVLEEGL